MPTIEEIINDVILREGPATNDPADHGGRTAFGISEKANPEAWSDGKVTSDEARAIFEQKYIKYPKIDQIVDLGLQAQMADYSVNSGPYIAIQALQRAVGAEIDGVLGPETLGLVNGAPDARLVGNRVVAERVLMFGRIVKKDITQVRFLLGWLDRTLSFLR